MRRPNIRAQGYIALTVILLWLLLSLSARVGAEESRELPTPTGVGLTIAGAPGTYSLYWHQNSPAKLVVVIRVQADGQEHIIAQMPGVQDKSYSVSDAITPGAKYFINELNWTAGTDVWGSHNGPYSYAQNGLEVKRFYFPYVTLKRGE